MDKKYFRFGIIWVANSLVVSLANLASPGDVVLGTYRMSLLMSVVFVGFLVTVACLGANRFLKKYVLEYLKGRYGMFVFYWGVNAVAVWVIARLAPVTGLGISAFYWALVLGFVLSFTQWLVRQGLKSAKLQ